MIRKPKENRKAIRLRKEGESIKDIASLLSVSPSIVSLWVRHIQLSPMQEQRLAKKALNALQRGRKKALIIQQKERRRKKNRLIKEALREIGKLSKRDIFVVGIALYWAEGFKKDNRLGFANSDPKMIKLFLKWLKIVGVPKENIRLRVGLNISHKERVGKVQKYWEKQTSITTTQFQKPFFQKFKWKRQFPNPEEYFGVLRIRAINQGPLFIKIHAWIEELQKS
ncbi:hypothetical protein CMO96_00020 [Candidatus Woesebacteria bacterium]|nr:hypothetical protein [Candidatus Woesebacteria bacterium]|tara:strand:+ start:52 stop:726 length:675 start_codon:yes stop_codon:yes gene_type:complete